MASGLTIYSTTWCGYCTRLKNQLTRAGVAFDEVDIEAEPEAEALVRAANGGNATVPTLVFADGRTLTNPPLPVVLEAVAAA
ncbi:MAG TPA: mycoredoxin [Mycobacteriales bacterium]|nr:mycoredoxin [Mycobacteriales bacterium]